MIKKILTFTLVTLWILLIIGCILFALYDIQGNKAALITLSILLTVPPGFLIIRRTLIRKKEKSFINRVITSEKQAIQKTASHKMNPDISALQKSWKESINRLRSSRLCNSGNPLYALPWYLVIGESRTGKTSMICHCGLSSPLSKTITPTTLNVTRNCDWWFFNEAIILDTAGRYTIPIDPKHDTPEWEEFLKLLARFRRKEPINGVVASISAEKLLKLSSDELIEQGSLIRARIDQVMRSLGSSFPVYVMVTKMDLVFGMTEFFRALPRSRLGQAMGWCNSTNTPCSDTLVDTAMNTIGNNLRMLRSRMLHGTNTPEAEVLIFPNKFNELSPGLRTFCSAVFVDNVYQVTPQFRGIYFSSALHKIKHGGIEKTDKSLSDQMLGGGMFLREFFSRVLPDDRRMFRNVPEYAVKHILDNPFFRTGWVALWILILLFTWSGYKWNNKTLQLLNTISSSTDDSLPVSEMEQIRNVLHHLHQKNSSLFPLRMGMHQSKTAEKQLKQYYLDNFSRRIHIPVSEMISSAMHEANPAFSEDSVMTAVTFLTTAAGLTLDRTADSTVFQEYYNAAGNYFSILFPDLNSGIQSLTCQYSDWILWSDQKTIDSFRQFIYDQLIILLEKKGTNLHWCTHFPLHGRNPVNMRTFWGSAAIPLVTSKRVASIRTDSLAVQCLPSYNSDVICTVSSLQNFEIDLTQSHWIRIQLSSDDTGWIASRDAKVQNILDTIQVSGAYTTDGFRRINEFLNRIGSRISDPELKISFNSQKSLFYRWYWENFYKQWYRVMDHFIEGFNTGVSSAILRNYMLSVPDGTCPSMKFIRTLAAELDSADTVHCYPGWRNQVILLRDTERSLQQKTRDSSATGLTKTKNSFFGLFKKIGKGTQEYVDQNALIRNRTIESSVGAWEKYRTAISALYNRALKPGGTLQFAHILFVPEDTGSEAYIEADDACRELKRNLFNDRADDALWRVMTGPLTILKKIAYAEAEVQMQKLWDKQVISKLRSSVPQEQVDFLFSSDTGLVHAFLDDPFVSAYIQTTPSGDMVPVEGPDGPLQFNGEFIEFLNRGLRYAVKSEYPLTVKTVPFSVNSDAEEQPYQTVLKLQCAEGATFLENFNHYETVDFIYRPVSCGEVSLKIMFPSFTVAKTWSGRWGFPQFLMTFRDGVNVIRSEDFDLQYQTRLQRKNISWVRISYVIDPEFAEEITDILRTIPKNIPKNIMAGL